MKSMCGVAVQEAMVEPWGLAGDRRWMVVDGNGRYLTQRELPGMARIAAAPAEDGGVVLSASGMGTGELHVPRPETGGPTVEVVV